MNKIVGLKALREDMETYIQHVGRGQSFVIVKKSKPVFSIGPVDSENVWEPVIDFSKIKKGGVKLEDILERL